MPLEQKHLENSFIQAPIEADQSVEKSILILAHGRGGKWRLMEWLSKRLKISGLDYVCVQAPFPEDVPQMKEPGYSWLLMPGHKGLDESRLKIQKFLKNLIGQGYDSKRIYWLGFSQGGLMGIDTALRSPFLLGGTICVSGFCMRPEDYPEDFSKFAREQKIIATHGRRDEIVSFEKAETTYEQLQKLGVSIELHEFNKPHSFELKNEIPFLEQTIKSWMS